MKIRRAACLVAVSTVFLSGVAMAAEPPALNCATPQESARVRDFYQANPGTMPAIAARRVNLAETKVVSSLPAAHAVSTAGKHFGDIWNVMTSWKKATFLIMKGANVFEVESGIAPVKPSKTSQYQNIEYTQPLRGHLRPDQYASIYAVAIPGKDGAMARGVLFYDADGNSVFGAFMSGEGPTPPAEELAKFDTVMKLIRSEGAVCPATDAAP